MKKFRAATLILVFTIIISTISYANSAGPPGFAIIAGNSPKDLEVYFVIDEVEHKAKKLKKIGETYFVHYDRISDNETVSKIIFRSSEKEFEIDMTHRKVRYDNLYTLDYKNETLLEGKSIVRSVMLILSRIILTLVIEGIIFYMFKYRSKRSWIAFLAVNLVTQGFLNISMNSISPVDSGYMIRVYLLVDEFIILITELIFLTLLIRENKKLHTILFVIVANITSLIIGMIFLPLLPI